ncbi:TolC family protein [Bradyrhizobium sp.]|uniref:TolC family protein n=1 Tax=Bradyrhizobium sp. TaxID=376 RepID=UPI003C259B7D
MAWTDRPDRFALWPAAWLGLGLLALGGCTLVPHPLTDADRLAEADGDRAEMFGNEEPLRHPLTLHEAFARALKYNLDGRVKLIEEALSQDDLDLSRYDLLPKAYINAAYTSRNNVNASSSQAVATGQQSLVPSTSTDQNDGAADLLLSWNILDFGVSYFGARQQSNRVLIGQEERRKVIQSLIQDVRRAFWRAASAQRLSRQIADSIHDAEAALPDARKVETEGLHSPVDSLRYQKALLTLIYQLESAQAVLAVSKIELAQLINLPPGQPYSLAVPHDLRLSSVRLPITRMEETALLLNPDIRELSYQKRISVDETHKALLRLLPGITFSYDPSYDSNSFLVNHYWATSAVRLGGYLSNLLTFPVTYRRAGNAEHLADLKREAMSMAVLAKLHIAYQQFLDASKLFRRAQEVSEVDERLYEQIRNRNATDIGGDLERISAKVSAEVSQLQRYQAYAETQAALGRLYAALGIDPLPEDVDTLDFQGLDRALRHAMAERNRLTPAANAEAAGSAVASRADERPAIAASAPAGEQAKLGVTEVAAAIAVDNSGPRSQPKPDASNPH